MGFVVPEGWRIVPPEVTPKMQQAAGETPGMKEVNGIIVFHRMRSGQYGDNDPGFPGEGSPMQQAWREMLRVAPEPVLIVGRDDTNRLNGLVHFNLSVSQQGGGWQVFRDTGQSVVGRCATPQDAIDMALGFLGWPA